MTPGDSLGPYRVVSELGEGGPPPLRLMHAELRRGLAEADLRGRE